MTTFLENVRFESDTVLYTTRNIPCFSREIRDLLVQRITATATGTIRLCLHPNKEAKLHEMIIVHSKDALIPIHRHTDKDESIVVYEGEMEVLFYDDYGNEQEKYICGNYASHKICHLRIPSMQWHTMRIITEHVCFCECTTGPFNPLGMEKMPF